MTSAVQTPFGSLKREKFILLTTFRKSGKPVSTPVWFAHDGDHLVVMTNPKSGKVKRLRHTAHVEVVASDFNGNPNQGAEPITAEAHFLPESAYPHAADVMRKKYTWQLALIKFMHRLRGRGDATYFEIMA